MVVVFLKMKILLCILGDVIFRAYQGPKLAFLHHARTPKEHGNEFRREDKLQKLQERLGFH